MDITVAIVLSSALLLLVISYLRMQNRSRRIDLDKDLPEVNTVSRAARDDAPLPSALSDIPENNDTLQRSKMEELELERIAEETVLGITNKAAPSRVNLPEAQPKREVAEFDSRELEEYVKHESEGRKKLVSSIADGESTVDYDVQGDGDTLVTLEQELKDNIENTSLLDSGDGLGAPDPIQALTAALLPEDRVDSDRIPAEKKRGPGKYNPPVLGPSTTKGVSPNRADTKPSEPVKRAYPLVVRALFQRHGLVQLSLLPGRQPELPEQLEGAFGDQKVNLIALVDGFFQDIIPPDLGGLLETGFEGDASIGDGTPIRWSLSGRQLYVLAPSNSLSGFISTTRLVLGEEYVVLCKEELLQAVQEVIGQTGSPAPEVFGPDAGLPDHWICLRRVVPEKPIPQSEQQDILNILRPLPEIELVLSNGIRIENAVWLAGYPPEIHIYGDLTSAGRIAIDGRDAFADNEGKYTAPGWNSLGSHNVYVAGVNKSYTIREIDESWNIPEALSNSCATQDSGMGVILGPIAGISNDAGMHRYPILVSAANSIVIGAEPGQVVQLEPKLGTDIACGDFVPFQPIWALPSNPHHVNKHAAGIVAIGEIKLPRNAQNLLRLSGSERELILAWSNVILAAARKGLLIRPASPESIRIWSMYKKEAKAIWRKLK